MAHITLRRDDGHTFKLPNKPLSAGDGRTGIISISRPYQGGSRRHTVMNICVANEHLSGRPRYETIHVVLNTAPTILTDLLDTARRSGISLDLSEYQVLVPRRKFGRGHSLSHTRAVRQAAELKLIRR